MIEQLVNFETAELAENKGFDYNTLSFYIKDGKHICNDNIGKLGSYDSCSNHPIMWSRNEVLAAPTQSLLQKWLREEHNLHISIDYKDWSDLPISNNEIEGNRWDFYIFEMDTDFYKHHKIRWHFSQYTSGGNTLRSYEQAMEAALIESLKIIS